VPALLGGGKVIVSTGTKTLQDQLYERDLPLVRDALRSPRRSRCSRAAPTTCACTTSSARRARAGCRRATTRATCRRSCQWAHATTRGDRGELGDVPENASIWPLVTSTRDNCLGSNCAHFRECHVMQARKDALEADIVVVNHHLFFADVMLRDEGSPSSCPRATR
jgi:ATP-dependent DNA helicase DinG